MVKGFNCIIFITLNIIIEVPKTINDYYYFIKRGRSIVLITIDIFNHYQVGI